MAHRPEWHPDTKGSNSYEDMDTEGCNHGTLKVVPGGDSEQD
jgi:hypothetical protein